MGRLSETEAAPLLNKHLFLAYTITIKYRLRVNILNMPNHQPLLIMYLRLPELKSAI